MGELLGNLGRAGAALLLAEVRGVRADLSATGRLALRTGLWGVVAFALCLWGGGVLTAAGVVALSTRVSLLAALLIVGALFAVLGVAAGLVARSRARQLEMPTRAVARRLRDHAAWWRSELQIEPPTEGGGESE